jgi:hypothetical protein
MPPAFAHFTDDPNKTPSPPLAHVAEDGRVHFLRDHLEGTAQRAPRSARSKKGRRCAISTRASPPGGNTLRERDLSEGLTREGTHVVIV